MMLLNFLDQSSDMCRLFGFKSRDSLEEHMLYKELMILIKVHQCGCIILKYQCDYLYNLKRAFSLSIACIMREFEAYCKVNFELFE